VRLDAAAMGVAGFWHLAIHAYREPTERLQIQKPDFVVAPLFYIKIIAAAQDDELVMCLVLVHGVELAWSWTLVNSLHLLELEVLLACVEEIEVG